ncbi:hypothetical protein NQZ68_037827 [Dissostichus eleginoides]|nr:hypothetical protein NQZ68_037827 [Dissostichus eleginoides]
MYPGDSCVWATSLWGQEVRLGILVRLGSDKHLFLLWLRLHHPRHHLQCPVMFDGARSVDVSVTGRGTNACPSSCDLTTCIQWQQVQMLYIP